MISLEDADRLADELSAAYETRRAISPLSDRFPAMTIDDAYAVQQRQVARWLAAGRLIKGRKVGLTSAAMQDQMGVNRPDFGVLHDQMVLSEAEPICVAAFLQPRVEPEVAFVLKRDISGPGVTVAEAAAAVDFVLPALEIIDSRIDDWRIGVVDTIADNASSGAVVLGSHQARIADRDLRLLGCNLYRDGTLVATGATGAAMGSPLASLTWLANTLAEHGERLYAGDIVLPGSVTAAQQIQPGETWTAHLAGLGTVTARFRHGEAHEHTNAQR